MILKVVLHFINNLSTQNEQGEEAEKEPQNIIFTSTKYKNSLLGGTNT
jgi:hypothetical protein